MYLLVPAVKRFRCTVDSLFPLNQMSPIPCQCLSFNLMGLTTVAGRTKRGKVVQVVSLPQGRKESPGANVVNGPPFPTSPLGSTVSTLITVSLTNNGGNLKPVRTPVSVPPDRPLALITLVENTSTFTRAEPRTLSMSPKYLPANLAGPIPSNSTLYIAIKGTEFVGQAVHYFAACRTRLSGLLRDGPYRPDF